MININKINEINAFNNNVELDLREVYKTAIKDKLNKWVYMGLDEIKINEELPIEEEFKRILYEIVKQNGSFKNFVLKRELNTMSLSLNEIEGAVIKGKFYSYNTSEMAIKDFLSLYLLVIKDKVSRDYGEVYKMIEDKRGQIEMFKVVDLGFVKFKPFMNRNIKITLTDKAEAEKIFKVYQEKQIEGEVEEVKKLALLYGLKLN